jgi:hypothetical protein
LNQETEPIPTWTRPIERHQGAARRPRSGIVALMTRSHVVVPMGLLFLFCACEVTTVESPPQPAAAPEPAPAPSPETAEASPEPVADEGSAAPTGPIEISESGIDACCLEIEARIDGQKGIAKKHMERAAAVCPGISKKVKDGETTRADATKALRVQTGEIMLPSACE